MNQRRKDAIAWVDKEIRKLITEIQKMGTPNDDVSCIRKNTAHISPKIYIFLYLFIFFFFFATPLTFFLPQGKHQVKFGALFEETANIFEALSGTLVTAKKQLVNEKQITLLC